MPRPGVEWLISRRTAWRAGWGILGVLVFGAAAVASVLAFLRAPHIDSGVLVLITIPFFVLALAIAWESLTQGLVRFDEQGYARPLGVRRAWGDVLAVGAGEVDGRRAPVLAVRADGEFPLVQDAFIGFADADAEALLAAVADRVPAPPGFAGLSAGEAWWAQAIAEAERAASVVRETTGREPVTRQRVVFGYPGLESAIRLDFGCNDAGERVELFCRTGSDLALTYGGRRWLRQHRRRSPDPAEQVGLLFGPHEVAERPSLGAGFDRIVVTCQGSKPLVFNAEEPDRF